MLRTRDKLEAEVRTSMKIGITYRVFFSLLGATCLAILSLFLIMRWSVDREFYRYLGTIDQTRLEQMATDLGRKYQERGNWNFLEKEPPRWDVGGLVIPPEHDAVRSQPEEGNEPQRQHHAQHRPLHRRGAGRLIVLDQNRTAVLGFNPNNENVNFHPIMGGGRTVGYVGLLSPKHFLHPIQVQFLRQQRLALSIAAAGIVLVVMVISLLLARRLVRPIKGLAAATHDIASGHYDTRISADSTDELGRLAQDFNNMAITLEKHEQERRQWVADISHELRTPIAVLRGEIEALLDGIRTITSERVRSLYAEVLRLNRLVDDLYQLSLSDIGVLTLRRENIDLARVLTESLKTYRTEFAQKGIRLKPDIPEAINSTVFADQERLSQLFANLFENSLRYTDEGGELVVSLTPGRNFAAVEFQDSKPGVPDEDLGRLFDRLYRVEGSRNRKTGGAGLGLAISKNIVEAHGGTISAHQSSLGGLLIRVTLPVEEGDRE
jgi:two-component system, OmpR family, sensor histidine kinase BaeS